MLIIKCKCGVTLENIEESKIAHKINFISQEYCTKDSNLCPECFIKDHKQKDLIKDSMSKRGG